MHNAASEKSKVKLQQHFDFLLVHEVPNAQVSDTTGDAMKTNSS